MKINIDQNKGKLAYISLSLSLNFIEWKHIQQPIDLTCKFQIRNLMTFSDIFKAKSLDDIFAFIKLLAQKLKTNITNSFQTVWHVIHHSNFIWKYLLCKFGKLQNSVSTFNWKL